MKRISLAILSLVSFTTLANCNKGRKEYEVVSIDNIKYLLYNGVDKIASVVGYNYGLSNEITLPNEVNGYPLKAIGKEAFEFSNLSKITIPDSIVYIGSGAFSECGYLKQVTLSNNLETLPSNTFKNCYSLTNITLPNSISLIEDEAFLGCYSLTNITMPNSLFGLGSYAFGGCESLNNVDFSKTRLYDIGSNCFCGCSKLSNISMSNNITVIAEKAFSYCSSLEKIYIPEFTHEFSYLGEDLFNNCNSNLKILFGGKLPTFYSYNFSSGYPFALGTDKDIDLTKVFVKKDNIQYSINNLKESTATKTAFVHYEDGDENAITIPDSITNGETTANVTELMPYSFSSKESLTSIDLSNLSKLDYIGANAFYYDTELNSVTLPSSETNAYLDIGTFYKCRKLKEIKNLDKINDLHLHGYTFAECYNLGKDTAFTFTKKIKSITSTDFKEWGTSGTQTILLADGSYSIDQGTGKVTLNAKGDKNGEIEETITLSPSATTSSEYSNYKYFGKSIIKLAQNNT